MLVDPVTQAAVSAGISASDVGHSVVETVVSTSIPQVVDMSTSGAEVSVGEAVGIPHGQVHIMEVSDGTGGASDGEALQTGHVTVEASDTLGITVPAEILAAMAAAQSHPHLLIATTDQQIMQAQVNVAAEQHVLEAHAVSGAVHSGEELSQSSEAVAQPVAGDQTSALGEQHQQQLGEPMETE